MRRREREEWGSLEEEFVESIDRMLAATIHQLKQTQKGLRRFRQEEKRTKGRSEREEGR